MAGGAVFGTDLNRRLAEILMGRGAQQPQSPNMFNRPFTAPTNDGGLPAFEAPGSSLPMPAMPAGPAPAIPRMGAATPMPEITAQAQAMPQAAAQMAPIPAPGDVPTVPPMPPPTPVRSDVMAAIQQLQQAGKLPEQWKGSFSPGYGEPV